MDLVQEYEGEMISSIPLAIEAPASSNASIEVSILSKASRAIKDILPKLESDYLSLSPKASSAIEALLPKSDMEHVVAVRVPPLSKPLAQSTPTPKPRRLLLQ